MKLGDACEQCDTEAEGETMKEQLTKRPRIDWAAAPMEFHERFGYPNCKGTRFGTTKNRRQRRRYRDAENDLQMWLRLQVVARTTFGDVQSAGQQHGDRGREMCRTSPCNHVMQRSTRNRGWQWLPFRSCPLITTVIRLKSMTTADTNIWLDAVRETVSSYRRMIDATVAQLDDDELFARPAPNINSVAIILRHLGGNLHSRWTDFLTTDGEKPTRDRDTEFLDWDGDRNSLIEYFDTGWNAMANALASIDCTTMGRAVLIRGESHSIPQALTRSLTHLSYHVGQIAIIARMVHVGDWKWLTIAPGASDTHNAKTWGNSASRSIYADPNGG